MRTNHASVFLVKTIEMALSGKTDFIPVTDLKQWAYCERIVYYHRVMPAVVKQTFKMKEAIAAQDLIESLETRRSLQAYGFAGARRRFNAWLTDEKLGLSAKTDLILERDDQIAVVDFKLTSGEPGENHRMQLSGYALLAETAYHLPSPIAFLYRIPDNRIFAIEITSAMRQSVLSSIDRIRKMEAEQWLPPATPMRNRCAECEFANYCADIW